MADEEQRPEQDQRRNELDDQEEELPPVELPPGTRLPIERPRHTLPVEPIDPT